ncbi:MAG: hypothetical protein E7351_01305 [Clostridiales bacterium]|nr:hypothetical protein [Clostridiales bacterium]
MKFKEFKQLVDRRKLLFNTKNKSPEQQQEMEKIEKEINSKGNINSLLSVKLTQFAEMVKKYFYSKGKTAIFTFQNSHLLNEIILYTRDEKYVLDKNIKSPYGEICLTSMYGSNVKNDFEKLEKKYPEIRDVFWSLIQDKIVSYNEERKGMFVRLIEENERNKNKYILQGNKSRLESIDKTTSIWQDKISLYEQSKDEVEV